MTTYINISDEWGDPVETSVADYRKLAETYGENVGAMEIEERDDGIYIDGERVAVGYTADQIIAARTGETNGRLQISEVDGNTLYWEWRTRYNADGTAQSFRDSTVCSPENADCIGLCGLYTGVYAVLPLSEETL